MVDDAELAQGAQAGNAAALGALLERHRGRLYATALSFLGERAEAQDAVQDTFLIALKRFGDLQDPNSAGAWLQAIVRNACRMRLRARREAPAEIPPLADRGRLDIDEALDRLALRDWVWATLEELPDDLRATVMLRFFSRHAAYDEIAAVLGIPVGTVRSRLNQAKHRLAAALMASTTAAHADHASLVQDRWHWWQAVADEVVRAGAATLYLADATPDALVEAPSLGYRTVGAENQARGMVESAEAGVRFHLTGLLAGEGITIVEGDYENPPDDPNHCPATHTEVRFHPDGRTTRIILYYPPKRQPDATAGHGDKALRPRPVS